MPTRIEETRKKTKEAKKRIAAEKKFTKIENLKKQNKQLKVMKETINALSVSFAELCLMEIDETANSGKNNVEIVARLKQKCREIEATFDSLSYKVRSYDEIEKQIVKKAAEILEKEPYNYAVKVGTKIERYEYDGVPGQNHYPMLTISW